MSKTALVWTSSSYLKMETITISKKEYQELKKLKEVDQELLQDIATGIKDILQGKVKEV